MISLPELQLSVSRRLVLTAVGLCAYFTACRVKDTHLMTQAGNKLMTSSTVLDLGGGKRLTVTLETAEKMRQALENCLFSSRKEIEEKVPPDLVEELDGSVGDPFIDNTGNVRMGFWLLESRKGSPALTFRPLPPGNHQYIVMIEQTGDTWKVVSFRFNLILLRR